MSLVTKLPKCYRSPRRLLNDRINLPPWIQYNVIIGFRKKKIDEIFSRKYAEILRSLCVFIGGQLNGGRRANFERAETGGRR